MDDSNPCKTYRGETASEALLKVKLDMGEQAEIVETRKIKQGGFFGFFSQTLVEVDAYQPGGTSPGGSSGNGNPANPGTPRSDVGTVDGEREPPASAPNEPPGKADPGGEDTPREWNLDEQTLPEFSPREQAARLIEQKSSSNPSPDTYERPRAGRSEDDGAGDAPPGVSDGDTEREQALSRLRETTDLLAEKIDDLKSDLRNERAPGGEEETQYPGQLQACYQRLLGQEVRPSLARELVSRVRRKLEPEELDREPPVFDQLEREISEDVPEAPPLMTGEGREPVLVPLIGPTGVGKTTTLAKLAAHFSVEENRSVGFITMDAYRLAAVEQLRCYADILQIPLQDVTRKPEFEAAVQTMEEERVELVFVDTGGCSQFDREKIGDLEALFDVEYRVIRHLVVSATTREEDLPTILEGFDTVGYERLLVTKLDETKHHGMIYNLVRDTELPVAYFTDGQDVPDDIWMAESDRVAKLLSGRMNQDG